MGLGYVGLPLAVEFAKVGFNVTGIDVQQSKVEGLNRGESHVQDVPSAEIAKLVGEKRFSATTDFSVVRDLDTINICVPTPLRKTKDPDMSYIVSACEEIAKYFHPGMLVILESTTYPGTTDELVLPMLRKAGLQGRARTFSCAFRPSASIPAIRSYQTKNIPKVVGGITPACTEMGAAVLLAGAGNVVPVSSTRVAEMVKLLENTFRMINIGLVNEMAMMCDGMGINVWEVIDAAATKPFGFMPFYPGPGLGGHCIPIDPFYLSWKTKQAGIEARFIELAGYINGHMPHFVVDKIQNALNDHAQAGEGIAHPHLRRGLQARYRRHARIARAGCHSAVEEARRAGFLQRSLCTQVEAGRYQSWRSKPLLESAAEADCVVIVTDHTDFDYKGLLSSAKLIVDTRNAMKAFQSEKIVRL